MSKDFIDFSKSQRNFTFLIILKASSQVALKFFLWLQKHQGFYNIRALQRTLNQDRSMRRTKKTQWKRSPSHVQRFYRFFKISEELYFPHFTEGVESRGSKCFSMVWKMIFKVSEGFYNIKALQRTLNQDHRRRRKKDTQGKLIFFKFFHPLAL